MNLGMSIREAKTINAAVIVCRHIRVFGCLESQLEVTIVHRPLNMLSSQKIKALTGGGLLMSFILLYRRQVVL